MQREREKMIDGYVYRRIKLKTNRQYRWSVMGWKSVDSNTTRVHGVRLKPNETESKGIKCTRRRAEL